MWKRCPKKTVDAFIHFHTLSYALEGFTCFHMLLYDFICFHTLLYPFQHFQIHFYTLLHAFIHFLYAFLRIQTQKSKTSPPRPRPPPPPTPTYDSAAARLVKIYTTGVHATFCSQLLFAAAHQKKDNGNYLSTEVPGKLLQVKQFGYYRLSKSSIFFAILKIAENCLFLLSSEMKLLGLFF